VRFPSLAGDLPQAIGTHAPTGTGDFSITLG